MSSWGGEGTGALRWYCCQRKDCWARCCLGTRPAAPIGKKVTPHQCPAAAHRARAPPVPRAPGRGADRPAFQPHHTGSPPLYSPRRGQVTRKNKGPARGPIRRNPCRGKQRAAGAYPERFSPFRRPLAGEFSWSSASRCTHGASHRRGNRQRWPLTASPRCCPARSLRTCAVFCYSALSSLEQGLPTMPNNTSAKKINTQMQQFFSPRVNFYTRNRENQAVTRGLGARSLPA